MNLFGNVYYGKKVLLTGDTGFKGSWMAYWLISLGAEVIGYSLPPNTNPSHCYTLNLDYKKNFYDITDINSLKKIIIENRPEIIFHLAAQPLVRYSYDNSLETFRVNVLGTATVLESVKKMDFIKAVIIITTDKCYENKEQKIGYIESDRMGGYDPYSSSKGCAELVIDSYRNSFFNLDEYKITHNTLIASARAGNVIGGGDWSIDRLIPDLIRSVISQKKAIIRRPNSTRPWQHVLEPISGYLLLGQKLVEENKEFAEGWNFGPEENNVLSVKSVLEMSKNIWNRINYSIEETQNELHETTLLSLNIEKAKSKLGWKPKWNNQIAIEKTINWYKEYYLRSIVMTENNLIDYIKMFY